MGNDEPTAAGCERRTCGTAVRKEMLVKVCHATALAGLFQEQPTTEGYWLAASRVYVVTSD